MELNASRSMPSGAVGALCLLFTGGTFRSRCVVTSLASGNRLQTGDTKPGACYAFMTYAKIEPGNIEWNFMAV